MVLRSIKMCRGEKLVHSFPCRADGACSDSKCRWILSLTLERSPSCICRTCFETNPSKRETSSVYSSTNSFVLSPHSQSTEAHMLRRRETLNEESHRKRPIISFKFFNIIPE